RHDALRISSQVVEPPTAPYDPRIAQQYAGLAGPAPVAPTPPSRGERIARALIGVGQGFAGNGPEYLRQLQEPQRRYEARLDDYNARRDALRLRGTEAALDRQERETARARRLADQEYDAE